LCSVSLGTAEIPRGKLIKIQRYEKFAFWVFFFLLSSEMGEWQTHVNCAQSIFARLKTYLPHLQGFTAVHSFTGDTSVTLAMHN